MESPDRRWITYREGQAISSLSRGTLWKLVEAGCVPAAKVGRRVLIDRVGLDSYLEDLARGRREET